ncbi:MAG: FAD-dependent oxidoreductase [Nostocoides sp.]
MTNTHYPSLFSPIALGPVTLRNRVLLSPMTTGFGFSDGAPQDRLLSYFSRRARDAGMVTVAFGAVAPEGRVEEQVPWMWRPDAAEVLAPLASAIRAEGAHPCLQLGHGGRQVSPRVIGQPPVAPSPLPPAVHTHVPPRPLSVPEIEEIVAAFGRAAAAAANAGFAAVEIHAGHGYLIQQFLSPQSNVRTDRYGGQTPTARARFGSKIVAEVSRSAPELAVLVRINGSDVVPGGLTPSDAAEAAASFIDSGAHALVVSAGVYGSVPYTIPLLDDDEATFLDSCAFIKDSVEVPVIAVGRFTLPATAEAALTSESCDAVAIGRGLLADPDWVAKSAAGKITDIRPCIATVQGCAGQLAHGGEISCAVNPSVGREGVSRIERVTEPASFVVVGGGPAGMEAARRAAELGHEVVLHEQRADLGGALSLASTTPALRHLRRLITWYERQLSTLGVEVRLGSRIDEGDLLTSDLVIAAVGAETTVPLLDGYEDLPSWTLEEFIDGGDSTMGKLPLPTRPVVLGGGTRALTLALWLSECGAEPTVLSPDRIGSDNSGLTRRALLTRLHRRGVTMLSGSATGLRVGAVEFTDGGGQAAQVVADGLVVCEPLRSRRFAMGRTGAPVVHIGDGRRVGDIQAAIADARDTVDSFTKDPQAAMG